MADNPSLKNNPSLDAWLALTGDGEIVARPGKVDIGQRISTALRAIVADEMGVRLDRVRMAPPSTDTHPDEGVTAGSNSIQQSGGALRAAAATARRHLLARAAAKLDADPESLEVADGLVTLKGTNQSVSYWELMQNRPFGIEVDADAPRIAREAHRLIGSELAPAGIADMVTGGFRFVHDLAWPDMRHARPVRPPRYGARLEGLDEAAVERLLTDGVSVVRDGSYLAVAADDEFAAIRGAERLARAARWSGGALDDADIFEGLRTNERISLPVADGKPAREPVPPLFGDATLTASYERPYLMHGSMAPSASAALFKDGRLQVWTHSQGIHPLRLTLAEALGLDAGAVTVNHVPGAGCYGHNGADDAAFDAAMVAGALPGRPVLLKWTRDDEHAWEPYGSAMAMDLAARLDDQGRITDWSHESFSDTHVARPRPGPGGAGPARLVALRHLGDSKPTFTPQPNMNFESGIHRNLTPGYDLGRPRLVKHLVRGMPLRTSSLRCLGAGGNVFAIESFMDELAAHAGRDALQFRLDHLSDPRAHAVLEAAASGIGWGRPAAEGRGLGLAYARYAATKAYAAVAVELSVGDDARIRLHRAEIAADVGEVIDMAGVRSQMEGGFLQAASWALYEQVAFDAGGITSRDWESYPILGFDNVPEIAVTVIDRPDEPPLGAGEALGGPTPAAIANAVYRASGLRLRRMPFTPDALRAAAMA
jgi:nicotinate dehydrogenase subunit B